MDYAHAHSGVSIAEIENGFLVTVPRHLDEIDVMDPVATQMVDEFQSLIKGELDPEKDDHQLGKLKVFSGVSQYPVRVKCAILSWHTVRGALHNKKQITTE